MNRTLRRVLTTAGATTGALALFTGTAAAHYCYMDAPAKSQAAKSKAWATLDDPEYQGFLAEVGGAIGMLRDLETELGDDCADALQGVLDAAEANAGALYMGPGLLAGGAVRQGKGPAHIGHLPFHAIPEACWALLEGPA